MITNKILAIGVVTKPMTTTKEKILYAAIELMSEKGYKAVTTKEIAKAATVSEMTLFRCFGSKKNILDCAIDKFSYSMPIKKVFEENIVWDLEKDLSMLCRVYKDVLKENRKIYLLFFREAKNIPELKEKIIYNNPLRLKKMLENYFSKMQEMKKMVMIDPEVPAINFISILLKGIIGIEELVSTMDEEYYIDQTVQLLIKALTP
ncbi:AcrR family transcriptional regulator [Scopulibacillus daqui]|uniref:AcrR family transcriptional regulator n=1 Tax=Scopulibacillus daqui TaxID=1469162 RepID=A0ABS2Q233_9BACL|nr:AcrR family transcriptional regulator [Scopulibacillus daqui]